MQYAVADYEALQKENLTAVEDTRKRFAEYRKKVTELVENLTEKDIHVKKLDGEDLENLQHLKIIEDYLNCSPGGASKNSDAAFRHEGVVYKRAGEPFPDGDDQAV